MKITITHDQSTIDPSGTYSDEDFQPVKAAYEKELKNALLNAYPNAEIEFVDGNNTYCVRVDPGIHGADPGVLFGMEDEITHIISDIYATGNFWL